MVRKIPDVNEIMRIQDKYSLKKIKCLSGSTIKLIALITMIIDHIGSVILRKVPKALVPIFSVMSHRVSVYVIFRLIGRIAFPLYCFLLVEGFTHTRSKKKYGINLLVFALISEIPWNLKSNGTLLYESQNVFFTLLIGFLGMCFYEKYSEHKIEQFAALFALLVFSALFKADYGYRGYCLIMLMYILRDKKVLQALLGSCMVSLPFAVIFAFVPINMYSGERGFIKGNVMKYAFYAAYPIHIIILYIIRVKYIGYT